MPYVTLLLYPINIPNPSPRGQIWDWGLQSSYLAILHTNKQNPVFLKLFFFTDWSTVKLAHGPGSIILFELLTPIHGWFDIEQMLTGISNSLQWESWLLLSRLLFPCCSPTIQLVTIIPGDICGTSQFICVTMESWAFILFFQRTNGHLKRWLISQFWTFF
jgi:hypothetical protein